MPRWKVKRVIQQGVVSNPSNPKEDGKPTILLVQFSGGLGEREVHLAPTIDREGIIRTLDSQYEAGVPGPVSGPPADDLVGMEGSV